MRTENLVQKQIANKNKTVYSILFAVGIAHLLNDSIQSIIPAIYPILKDNYSLTFTQIGIITLAFQLTASILQPFIGLYTDKKPRPMSLVFGMVLSFLGLLCLAFATNFGYILASVSLLGIASSVFHPEASKVAYFASGGKRGLAQSIFQVGGNAGNSIGPLLTAFIILPFGQKFIGWIGVLAVIGIFILIYVGRWYQSKLSEDLQQLKAVKTAIESNPISKTKIVISMIILLTLMFSKNFYMASMTNYFTFFLIDKFNISIQESQLYLFVFLVSVAIGTIIGGPLGDRYGRKLIIWVSILGAAPFTLLLPHMGLTWTMIMAICVGLVLSSAFSAIVVFATELIPNKIGLVSGLLFGLSFGFGGIGSAILGSLADVTSIEYVFNICAFLPLIGVVTIFLPDIKKKL
ncbi:MFS transporter [Myroides odoratimimus]|uniref:MFS transporter n=1 Tax=Myroides odoratimimus TaxID=76832 RepID=UPI003100E8B3